MNRSISAAQAQHRKVLDDVSIELLPEQAAEFVAARHSPARIPLVFLTHIRGKSLQAQVEAARLLTEAGFDAVPHLAARNFSGWDEFTAHLARLSAVKVGSLLLLGGNPGPETTPIGRAIELLRHPAIKNASIARVFFAGYPEGHPVIPHDRLTPALLEKIECAKELGLASAVVSQFAFDGAAMTRWASDLRVQGIEVPVRFGLAGVTSLPKLMKFAKLCGVGPSLSVLTRNISSVLKIVREHDPGATAGEIELGVKQHAIDGAGLHLFPFGGFDRTLAWLEKSRLATEQLLSAEADCP